MSGGSVQLLQCLAACLSPSAEVRQAAEAHLRVATKHPGYGPALLEIGLSHAVAEDTRQLAGLVLKQYIKHHWIEGAKWFMNPVVNPSDKAEIRKNLLLGVGESSTKVRVALGLCVAGVAKWDWPQEWPDLMPHLLTAISDQQRPDAVKGALRCLSLLADDIDERQVTDLAPALLPQLLPCVVSAPPGSTFMQRQALHVVHGVMNALSLVSGVRQRATRDLLAPFMHPYISVLCKLLESKLSLENGEEWGVKMEALKLVVVALTYFRKLCEPFLPQLLSSCWQLYTSSLALFEAGMVEATVELPQDQHDEDGDAVDLEALISQMFEVLLTVVGSPATQSQLQAALPEMVYLAMRYMQMGEEQVQTWTDDPNQYLADEIDSVYTLRASGEVLIDQLVKVFDYQAANTVMAAVERCLQEAHVGLQHVRPSWWKLREAALFAVGTAAESLLELVEQGTPASKQLQQQLQQLLQNVLHVDLRGEGSKCPFLVGRALWLASAMPQVLTPQQLADFQSAAASGLTPSMPPAVQMGACRALAQLCPKLERSMLGQHAPQILSSLVSLLAHTSEDSQNLVLETMTAIIKVSPEAAAQHQRDIAVPVLQLWEKSVADPFISTATVEVLEALMHSPAGVRGMAAQVVPALTHVLMRPPSSRQDMMVEASLDLLEKVVQAGDGAMAEAVWMAIASPLMHIMNTSYDDGVLQNGTQVLTALVRKGGAPLLTWGNQDEQDMLRMLLQVVLRLLHPDLGDAGSIFVGDLMLEILQTMQNQVGPHVPTLLTALVVKLVTKDTSTRTLASLLLVLCHLARLNAAHLMDMLKAINVETAGVSGKNGLQTTMEVWMEHHFDACSAPYSSKVSTAALVSLLQSQHSALSSLMVQGKQVEQEGTGVRTRLAVAREGGRQYTSITLAVKLVTMLVKAVMYEEERDKGDDLPGWEAEDDDDDEWESDEDVDVGGEEAGDGEAGTSGRVERSQSVGGLQVQGSAMGAGTQGPGVAAPVVDGSHLVETATPPRQLADPVNSTTVAALAREALKQAEPGLLQAALQELTPKQVEAMRQLVQA